MNLFGSCASCDHMESLCCKLINPGAGVRWAAGMGDSSFNVSGKATWHPEAAAMIGAPANLDFYC